MHARSDAYGCTFCGAARDLNASLRYKIQYYTKQCPEYAYAQGIPAHQIHHLTDLFLDRTCCIDMGWVWIKEGEERERRLNVLRGRRENAEMRGGLYIWGML